MFRFGSQAQQSGETLKALSEEGVTFEKLLKCSDLSNAYRSNNNPKLLGYLLTHIEEIFVYLMKTKNRQDHKSVLALYQTSNMALHRCFADSIALTEFAFQSIDKENKEYYCPYAAGTMYRFLSRAMDSWPNETHEVFRFSNSLYKLVISNIANKCIFYAVNELITSNTHPIGEFVWNMYRSLSGDFERHPPRICFLSTNKADIPFLDLSKDDENQTVRQNVEAAVELLRLYFKTNQRESKVRDFKEIVLDFIVSIAKDEKRFIPDYYELAKEVGYNKELQDITIDTLKDLVKNNNLENAKVAPCVSYLVKCAAQMSQDDVTELVISLISDKVTMFALLNLVEFVQEVVKSSPSYLSEFVEAIEQLIAYSWNVFHETNQMIVSILIELARAIPIKNSLPPIFATNIILWKTEDFINSSNNSESNPESNFDTHFAFPQRFYKPEFINEKRWGEKLPECEAGHELPEPGSPESPPKTPSNANEEEEEKVVVEEKVDEEEKVAEAESTSAPENV